jgi:hypothetical protein
VIERLGDQLERSDNRHGLGHWLGPDERSVHRRGADRGRRLPTPTPVYITYFTAMVGTDGVEHRPDPYGRDDPEIAPKGLRMARAGPSVADGRT